jgi:hypothetical protein
MPSGELAQIFGLNAVRIYRLRKPDRSTRQVRPAEE